MLTDFISWVCIIALLSSAKATDDSSRQQTPLEPDAMANLNVFKKPLQLFSTYPMTGFYRDGYCRTSAADFGNHAVAGVVSDEFLDFTASRGNDLRVVGLTGGCKWCLCTGRWMEAYQAFRDGRISRDGVPRVDLDATEDSVLSKVDLGTLGEFAVRKEVNGN